ncbi:MAG: DNA gyrase inhibitor YacG [Betaproteobacteria bacterium]
MTSRPCPHCGKPVEWGPQSPFRPFCSERCKLVDLHGWATEKYRVAAVDPPDDEETPPPERGEDR